jgi:hypothetical protein
MGRKTQLAKRRAAIAEKLASSRQARIDRLDRRIIELTRAAKLDLAADGSITLRVGPGRVHAFRCPELYALMVRLDMDSIFYRWGEDRANRFSSIRQYAEHVAGDLAYKAAVAIAAFIDQKISGTKV